MGLIPATDHLKACIVYVMAEADGPLTQEEIGQRLRALTPEGELEALRIWDSIQRSS